MLMRCAADAWPTRTHIRTRAVPAAAAARRGAAAGPQGGLPEAGARLSAGDAEGGGRAPCHRSQARHSRARHTDAEANSRPALIPPLQLDTGQREVIPATGLHMLMLPSFVTTLPTGWVLGGAGHALCTGRDLHTYCALAGRPRPPQYALLMQAQLILSAKPALQQLPVPCRQPAPLSMHSCHHPPSPPCSYPLLIPAKCVQA